MSAEGLSRSARFRGLTTRRALVAFSLIGITGLVLASLAVGIGRDPTIIASPLIGHAAPPLSGTTLSGSSFDLAAARGKVTIVNFWASWCVECRREHPDFVLAAERYQDAPVAFVGVLFQDSAEAARAYMGRMGGDWPNVLDPTSRTAIDWGVYGVPETFLVDQSGAVRAKVVGPVDYARLTSWIDQSLAASPANP